MGGRGCNAAITVMILAAAHGSTRATDSLRFIPANSAGLVSFRNPERFDHELTAFIRKIQPDFEGLGLDEFESFVGLKPGTIDASKRVQVILLRPEELNVLLNGPGIGEGDEPSPVVLFTPKDRDAFMKKVGGRENRARRQTGPYGKYYLLMRDGIAFVSDRRKPLRVLRFVKPADSFSVAFDDELKAIYADSDVFVHLPLARWRERLSPYLMLGSNLLKLGITSQMNTQELAEIQALVNWMFDGFLDAFEQMRTFTLALTYDAETFRLRHYHTFAKNQWMARYLGQVQRPDFDSFAALPDRPFLMVGAANWKSAPSASLTCRLYKQLLNNPAFAKKLPDQAAEKLLAAAEEAIGQTRGVNFMLASPPGRFIPMQVLGSYTVTDARAALRAYRFLQENMSDALGGFMPGGNAFCGKFSERRRDGVKFLEMSLNLEHLTPMARQQARAMYGDDAVVQETAVGEHHVVYAITRPSQGIFDLVNAARTGQNVGRNEAVRRIRACLPRDSHCVLIVDLGRILRTAPFIMTFQKRLAGRSTEAESASAEAQTEQTGPLLGWSCRLRAGAIDGSFAMAAEDVLAVTRLVDDPHARSGGARAEKAGGSK